ncbi:MAG: Na+/H+ antiporter subunit E [Spirochaeta sp.]
MISRDSLRKGIIHSLRYLWLVSLCAGSWMLFSQDLETPAIVLGCIFSAMAAGFTYHLFFSQHFQHSRKRILRLDLLVWYFVILLIQSYISSAVLIYRMLTGRYNSRVVRIRTRLKSSLGKVLLANTISMIPGTLSMWMDGRHIYVHCFDISTTHSIDAGRQIKDRQEHLLARIFG